MALTEHAGAQLAKKKTNSGEAESEGQAVTGDTPEPSAPCPRVAETKKKQFGAHMGGRREDSQNCEEEARI